MPLFGHIFRPYMAILLPCRMPIACEAEVLRAKVRVAPPELLATDNNADSQGYAGMANQKSNSRAKDSAIETSPAHCKLNSKSHLSME
jgi:hypothetical protein